MSHSVITNVGDRGDPAHESLVVKALARAGRATPPGRSIKRTLVGATGVRATARGERTGRGNWGPSAAGGLVPELDGIIHKPVGGLQGRRCGHSKRRAGRTR